VRQFIEHYQTERPHQGLGNLLLARRAAPALPDSHNKIHCHARLSGLCKHYYRPAA
jgi:hypothetical protein